MILFTLVLGVLVIAVWWLSEEPPIDRAESEEAAQ